MENAIPLSIGYFGHYIIQPGLKLGAAFEVQAWKNNNKEGSKFSPQYISPQVGLFIRPNTNTNVMFNGEFGHQWTKKERKRYSALGVGLRYIYQSQILSKSVDLSTGELTKTRESRHFFMPSLSYTLGGMLNARTGWYTKCVFGPKFSPTVESVFSLFLETGVKIPVNTSNN